MSAADEPRTTEYWKTALVIARTVIDDSGLLSQPDADKLAEAVTEQQRHVRHGRHRPVVLLVREDSGAFAAEGPSPARRVLHMQARPEGQRRRGPQR